MYKISFYQSVRVWRKPVGLLLGVQQGFSALPLLARAAGLSHREDCPVHRRMIGSVSALSTWCQQVPCPVLTTRNISRQFGCSLLRGSLSYLPKHMPFDLAVAPIL